MFGRKPPILWKRGALWLAFLGPFFFISYGWVNHFTSQRTDIGVVVSAWEHALPFVPWLMLPYMSIDLFYAISLFLFRKRRLLDRHALRLLLATCISLAGFLLYPLQFSFPVPRADGFNGFLQNVLLGFDQPYNQAPSMHISLLIILWIVYAKKLHRWARLALHCWFAAIAVSVLLVYQHHFIDLWTGAIVGVICLYLIPDPPFFWRWNKPSATMRRIALNYALVSVVLLLTSFVFMSKISTYFALLWWPALSFGMIALAYFGLERQIFQRHAGNMRWPARLMLAPYLFAAWLSYRYFSKDNHAPVQICQQVWLSAFPRTRSPYADKHWHAIIDLTNEFATHTAVAQHKIFIPVLDLVPPSHRHLRRAVTRLEKAQQQGHVLIHCALGLSRSASVVACWLVWKKHEASIETACSTLAKLRPGILLTAEHKANIQKALRYLNGGL